MINREKEVPCRSCTERHESCHGTCDRYLTWKAKHQEVKDHMFKERDKTIGADCFLVDKRDRFRAFRYDKRRR